MKRKFLTAIVLAGLCLATLILTINSGLAQLPGMVAFESPSSAILNPGASPQDINQVIPTTCSLQPERNPSRPPRSIRIAAGSLTLERFRRLQPNSAKQISDYMPKEEIALANPSNFGDRFLRDMNGNPANLEPIVVLHETVGSASSAINLFLTYHPRDIDQASYHTLVKRDGTLVYIVPPDKRAFGAGNSIFMGSNRLEAVQTNPKLPPSVNNFAYHVSLETPFDGNNNGYRHSGYTEAQYQSLAWLVAKTGVDNTRITTHKGVDRSRSRIDPRSFDTTRFTRLLEAYPKTSEIEIRCTDPTQTAEP